MPFPTAVKGLYFWLIQDLSLTSRTSQLTQGMPLRVSQTSKGSSGKINQEDLNIIIF